MDFIPAVNTYEDVARRARLQPIVGALYLHYMKVRWEETEEQKCRDGYAMEWAIRFKEGREFYASDSVGQMVLQSMCSLYK
jgi:hypothetical protein